MEDNITRQAEEVEALISIFGNEWKTDSEISASYSMQVTPDIHLFITLGPEYPSDGPPEYDFIAPSLTTSQKQQIYTDFENIYLQNCGEPILFQWIDRLKEIKNANEVIKNSEREDDDSVKVDDALHTNLEVKKWDGFNIVHGPVIQDRKSVFQGHVCVVHSLEHIKIVMDCLCENKKVAEATHNILAYRMYNQASNGSLLQDCDDDGETNAGGRLLHLLQILDITDVVVIVSRWYGGIHLGPARFRHINNAARQALQEARLIP